MAPILFLDWVLGLLLDRRRYECRQCGCELEMPDTYCETCWNEIGTVDQD